MRVSGPVLAMLLIGICMSHESYAANLEAGDTAPEFALVGSDGQTYELSSFEGKKAVVVAWFPKAFTGG